MTDEEQAVDRPEDVNQEEDVDQEGAVADAEGVEEPEPELSEEEQAMAKLKEAIRAAPISAYRSQRSASYRRILERCGVS